MASCAALVSDNGTETSERRQEGDGTGLALEVLQGEMSKNSEEEHKHQKEQH